MEWFLGIGLILSLFIRFAAMKRPMYLIQWVACFFGWPVYVLFVAGYFLLIVGNRAKL